MRKSVINPGPSLSPKENKPPEFAPTAQSERIISLDVVRGIAVLGILLMNIIGFGLANAYDDPTVAGGALGWNYRMWAFGEIFIEGTMRGLFTMLFGLGFMLFTTRGIRKGAGIETADYYYKRMFWLMIFGLIHSYFLLWYGDILFTYAICGMMLFVFRKTKPVNLMVFGVLLLTVGTFRYVADHNNMVETHNGSLKAQVSQNTDTYSDPASQKAYNVQKENKIMQQDYLTILKHRYPRSRQNQTGNLYNYNIWDSMAFMLMGMAFFSWGIFHGRKSYKFYLAMMAAGYVVGLTINIYEVNMIKESNFHPVALTQANLTFHAGRLFTTLGHIGLIMLFIKSGIFRFLQNALSAVGRMAFTNYIMQTIICSLMFLGFGFGLFGKLQRYELYYIVLAIWIVQLIYSPLWFKYFKYGPLEWVWKSLTYSKFQPILKTVDNPAPDYNRSLQR